jgi:short-subunit dehydrogenase
VELSIGFLGRTDEETGGKLFVLAIDLMKQSDIESIIPSIEKAGLPPVDVLVNNVRRRPLPYYF